MGQALPDTFAEALASRNVARVASFPKADRHCHSSLGASLGSIERWTGSSIRKPPAKMASFNEMRDYMHTFLYPHINNREGFQFTAEQSVKEAVEDGVTILEMSLDVRFAQFYPEETALFDFINGLVTKYAKEIDFRPEIGVSKNRPPATQILIALGWIDSALFKSIDLYGNEEAQPPEPYQALYRYARNHGLKLKAHVGEFGDPALIERTIGVLDLQEVQHGVNAASSKPLMAMLRREGIRLNVCPTSNVALSVATDLAHHPIRILMDNEVRVSINSDDKTVFGRSVSEEYLVLFQNSVASGAELEEVRVDSLRD